MAAIPEVPLAVVLVCNILQRLSQSKMLSLSITVKRT